jgi:PAS domain S-box-containing protein
MTIPSAQKPISHPLDVYGDTKSIARIFNWFISMIIIGLVAGIVVVLSTNNTFAAKILGLCILPVLASVYFIRRNKFESTAVFLSIVLISLITTMATERLGHHQIGVVGYPAILMVAGLVVKNRTMVFLTLFNIACVAWLAFGETAGAYTPDIIVPNVSGDFFSITIILILTVIMVRLISQSLFQSSLQLQKELRERKLAEEKYRNIFDNAIDGIFQSTPDGRFINVNPAMARMYGYSSPEEMIESITDISSQIYVDSEFRNSVRSRLANGEKLAGFELREYRKDGSTLWTSMNAQAILDMNGNIQYYEGTVEDITSRKMADEILQESEERFHTLFNRILDGVYRSSHDGRFLDVNPAMIRMFGYESKEEMLAVDIKKDLYFTPEERESLFLDTGQEKVDEFRMRRKDGSEIWVEDHGHYVHDENGNVIFHEGVLRDITERKHAEIALQNNQQRLQAFFNQSLDGFFFSMFDHPQKWDDTIDREKTLNHIFTRQRYTDVNNAMLEQYKITREKFLSLTSSDIFAHDPQQGLNLRRQLFDKGHLHTETYERREDGAPAWFEGEYVCLYDEQKRITGFFGIQRDITRRKQAEIEREQLINELAAKNAESETLRESFAAIVGTFEFSEIIQHILDQIKRVIPYDSASVWKVEGDKQKFISGRHLPPMFLDANIEFITDETNSALPILRGEVPYILNNNVQEELADFKQEPHTYVNSWLAIPLKTHGKIIGLIALDGREKNQFEEHHAELAVAFANQVAIALENSHLFSELQNELFTREKLIKELESKNNELERFTYTISHDLKSPLVTINGFLGYLKTDAASGPPHRVATDIQRIQDAVDKMHLLLRELLELSRIGRIMNPPEEVLFNDLVREALELVHGQLDARGVTVHTQPDLPAIRGDRQRLTVVLQNLVDNAAKYMGDQPAPRIEIGQRGQEEDQLIFFVKDNGIGIDPQHHERIFGLFNKLDPKTEGTGVGLALVKRIIEVHGGRIWVESEPGKGTVFYFTLPRAGH